MNVGDLVFFKKAKRTTSLESPVVEFKGYGFGLMLGHVPAFEPEPPAAHLLRMMGTLGFISFDDLGEFLGPSISAAIIKQFEDKYYGKHLVAPSGAGLRAVPDPAPSPDAPPSSLL